MFTTLEGIKQQHKIIFDEKYLKYTDIILNIFNNNYPIENADFTDGIILNVMGLYYEKQKINYEMAKIFYILSIKNDNNNNDTYGNILSLYTKYNDFGQVKKYALLGVESNCSWCFHYLGKIYEQENNNELAIENYLKAINKGHIEFYICLIKLYLKLNNKELALKYYLKELENNNKKICDDYMFEFFSDNPVELYVEVSKINQPNTFILELLTKLSENKSVKMYLQAVNFISFDTDQKRKRVANCEECLMEY
jgi:tetratricopeptide (TPR) repeat protein